MPGSYFVRVKFSPSFNSNNIGVFLPISRYCRYSLSTSDQDRNQIRHLFIISCYKEPIDLIHQNVDTVANQTYIDRISMIISFEERTSSIEEKCRTLREHYSQAAFQDLLFTIRPYGIPNEINGKCSSANYALRQFVQQLNFDKDVKNENIIVSTSDTHSQFHHQYITALTYQYVKDNVPVLTTIYQPTLVYH